MAVESQENSASAANRLENRNVVKGIAPNPAQFLASGLAGAHEQSGASATRAGEKKIHPETEACTGDEDSVAEAMLQHSPILSDRVEWSRAPKYRPQQQQKKETYPDPSQIDVRTILGEASSVLRVRNWALQSYACACD